MKFYLFLIVIVITKAYRLIIDKNINKNNSPQKKMNLECKNLADKVFAMMKKKIEKVIDKFPDEEEHKSLPMKIKSQLHHLIKNVLLKRIIKRAEK